MLLWNILQMFRADIMTYCTFSWFTWLSNWIYLQSQQNPKEEPHHMCRSPAPMGDRWALSCHSSQWPNVESLLHSFPSWSSLEVNVQTGVSMEKNTELGLEFTSCERMCRNTVIVPFYFYLSMIASVCVWLVGSSPSQRSLSVDPDGSHSVSQCGFTNLL